MIVIFLIEAARHRCASAGLPHCGEGKRLAIAYRCGCAERTQFRAVRLAGLGQDNSLKSSSYWCEAHNARVLLASGKLRSAAGADVEVRQPAAGAQIGHWAWPPALTSWRQ